MPENIPPSSYRLEFKSFHDWNGGHPSQTLIFHTKDSSWWIKVVVDWSLPESILVLGYFKRRSILQRFIEAIDFEQLHLLGDTVTNITLSMTEQSQNSITIRDGYQTSVNFYIAVAHQMRCKTAEDPKRASCLRIVEVIAPTVSTVLFKQQKFAYKMIDRPIYEPEDTEHILNEIDALIQLRGEPNIAQLVVITGFLLEYYSGGSLEEIIEGSEVQHGFLLVQWALQIGRALESLHKRGRSHLDVKPSNIVFDARKNAILIDVSGTGGYVWEWLSPEMQMFKEQNIEIPLPNTSFEARVASDSWAYGRLLSKIAERSDTDGASGKLQVVADDLTKAAPEARISLGDALAKLQEKDDE
ncbi:hypothetical protein N7471_002090 [Penicillium samsonianum]|uniref:uncharacterized protein n=1 Tax=Penicillium samsonianum TaxID=1882272 RepID=UPI0025484EFA|nr:uncharacterized protein N7471_002090 [Penicillium samsonianum]KAJ6142637.1 hypothetical protein N7471_002090 [Penicillium samsonianum]